jgi:general secretion pathway protein H
MWRPFHSRGFTLLEILVVLAVMVMILTVVPPMLGGGMTGAELKSAARSIAAGLNQARSQAISRQREATLNVNVDSKIFQVSGVAREYHLPAKAEVKLDTARSELASEGVGAIRFFPDGSSTGGRITVSRGEQQYRVDVEWLTGRVRILD